MRHPFRSRRPKGGFDQTRVGTHRVGVSRAPRNAIVVLREPSSLNYDGISASCIRAETFVRYGCYVRGTEAVASIPCASFLIPKQREYLGRLRHRCRMTTINEMLQ